MEVAARGRRRAAAAYLAGLAAYRMGDFEEARRHLAVGARSPQPATAGSARAVLGLMLIEQQHDGEAAAQLAEASALLAGEDARRAASHAASAYQRAGVADSAARWLEIARRGGSPPPPGGGGGFTLQVGAFRERRHADRAASEAAGVAERHGLLPVQVVPGRDDRGRTLYLVQFGRFESRLAAAAARGRLGELQFIVATLPIEQASSRSVDQ